MGWGISPTHEVNIYDNKTIMLPVDLNQNDNIPYCLFSTDTGSYWPRIKQAGCEVKISPSSSAEYENEGTSTSAFRGKVPLFYILISMYESRAFGRMLWT